MKQVKREKGVERNADERGNASAMRKRCGKK